MIYSYVFYQKLRYKGIPKEQKNLDWLIADFEDTFNMQKTRTITGVGIDEKGKSIPLPQVINGDNYNEEELMSIILEQCKKNQKQR